MTTLGNTEASATFPTIAADVGADASGAAAAAQSAAATDATTKANAAQAAAIAASQPVDSDLTAIAALTTTSYGRAFLALADAAAARTALALGTAATHATGDYDATGAAAAAQAASQPLDSDLTALAALTTTSYGRSLLEAANAAGLRTLAGSVIGTDVRAQASGDPTRASLGLATSDSPQFAGVNVGDAADTTLSRASAGVLQVEANVLYSAGGTDVPVADGGTGASTALAARANLGAGSAAIRGLLPTGALYHTFPRWSTAGNLGLLSTGRLSIVMIEMDAGVTLTSITFLSGTTALTVGVNQWFALFDSSRAKLRVTSDDTSTAWAANTEKKLNLSSTFLTTYSGIYYLGIMVKATTVPSLIAATGNANVNAVVLPITGGNSTTGLTDPASCPDPAGAIAGGVGFPYAYVS